MGNDFLRNNMYGTEIDPISPLTKRMGEVDGVLDDHATQSAEIRSQNNNTVTYGYDASGNIQTVTEKDSVGNTVQTVSYTYNATGDVSTSVTVANGKTVTITYNYDANGNITSTVNALS